MAAGRPLMGGQARQVGRVSARGRSNSVLTEVAHKLGLSLDFGNNKNAAFKLLLRSLSLLLW
jgi:hypothetical protein